MSSPKHLLLLQTGRAVPLVHDAHGDFPVLFDRGLQGADLPFTLEVVDVMEAPPDRLPAADGVIVSGSASMVAENTPWMQQTQVLMRQALDDDTPMLGVCFGHQLLGVALGCDVGPNHRGRMMGTVDVERHDGKDDALLQQLPQTYTAQVSHVDVIRDAAGKLEVVGTSPHDPHHMVRVPGARAWGVQYHPEFTPEVSALYLDTRREAVDAEYGEGHTDKWKAALRQSPHGPSILSAFVRMLHAD